MKDAGSQNLILTSGKLKTEEAYWLDQLQGLTAMGGIPIEMSRRPLRGDQTVQNVHRVLPTATSERLLKIANGSPHALYMMLVTGVVYMINRYSEQTDVVIGMPVLSKQTDNLLNPAVALRIRYSVSDTFKELLLQVKTTFLGASKHQNYPFAKLAEQIGLTNVDESMPLFQTIVSLDRLHDVEQVQALQADTHFAFVQQGTELQMVLLYNDSLFQRETMERLANHLLAYYAAIAENPDLPLLDIEVLSEAERQQLLYEFNRSDVPYAQDHSVIDLFEEQVAKHPDRIALTFEGKHMTYAELNTEVNKLAWYLKGRGAGDGQVIGVKIERSPEQVIGTLAIVKTGAVYVPIDPDYPQERIRYLLTTAQAAMMLVKMDDPLDLENTVVVNVREVLDRRDLCSDNLCIPNDPDRPLYVLFTSGSTGNPKGVRVKMHSYVNLLTWFTQEFSFGEHDTMLQIAPNSFDLAQKNIFGPLVSGSRLCLFSSGPFDYQQMSDLIERENITLINCAPSASYPLVDFNEETDFVRLRSVRILFLGGEPINVPKLRPWLLHEQFQGELVNTYGPTEATDVVSYYRVSSEEIAQCLTVPIGYPVYNDQLYVLDEQLRLLPRGMIGQLYVGGVGVSLGYYNRPDLTEEKFVHASQFAGGRLYKTGDRGRWREDGLLEYLGRVDHQLKVRGMRVEASEIEAQLLELEHIREAVVVDRKDVNGDTFLSGYFVADTQVEEPLVRAGLSAVLPAFMVPAFLIQLPELPLTPNGKIDRKALPDPLTMELGTRQIKVAETVLEAELQAIWVEALGRSGFGVLDSFVSLGGHSLQAIAILSRIYKRFKVNLPLSELFQHQTIRELAERIGQFQATDRLPLVAAPQADTYPVSSAQQRMLIMQHFEGVGSSYNIPFCMMLTGEVDRELLQAALDQLVRRHESLRTSFHWVESIPVQRIHPDVRIPLLFGTCAEHELPAQLEAFIQPFDLAEAPLIRAKLLQMEEKRYALIIDMHHIITDGVSNALLLRELFCLYHGMEVPNVTFQYKDFAVWQKRLFESGYLAAHEAFWLEQFAEERSILQLPTDFPRPALKSFEGAEVRFVADQSLTRGVQQVAAATGTTLYMVLLTAFSCLLATYANQQDIVVGSPVAGRSEEDLQQTVGMFVNMLAMKNTIRREQSFRELLMDAKQNALLAFDHQDYPFDLLVDKLGLQGDASRNPLFDVAFVFQSTPFELLQTDALQMTLGNVGTDLAKFDLTLQVMETTGELQLMLEYCTKLFQPETIERMAEHLLNLLTAITASIDVPLEELNILSIEEKHTLLETFNQTAADFPEEKTIVQLFEEQAAQRGEAVALLLDGATMSYAELNRRANQLAHHLITRGVRPGQLVGCSFGRSFEMIVGLLGILKTGAAYVPIDPTFPTERIRFLIEDTGMSLLLTQAKWCDLLPAEGVELVLLDRDWEHIVNEPKENLVIASWAEDVAYVIYTSGSTGTPKGVLVPHRGVVRLVKENDYFTCSTEDVFVQFNTISFDASIFEIWGSLLNGAKLALCTDGPRDLGILIQALRKHKVTTLFVTTALFNLLVDHHVEDLATVRQLMFGGEANLSSFTKKARAALPNCRLQAVYGPTETTVFASGYLIEDEEDLRTDIVPIGRPIRNTTFYVLSGNQKLVPIGVPGELCIGGPGLALGYLHRPELTETKWIRHPFSADRQERLYRTGDLVRWRADGNLEFLGRLDNQVKFRGYRIELGEIEVAIRQHHDVQHVIVQLQEDQPGDKRLVAYVEVKPESELTAQELRRLLQQKMPEYMVPTHLVWLNQIPLSPSGKLDRSKLPSVTWMEQAQKTAVPFHPDTLEWKLMQMWQDLFGQKEIGLTDNFFDRGGHSLLALRMIIRIKEELGIELSLSHLLQGGTIRDLAAVLRSHKTGAPESSLVPMQLKGENRPLFFVHPVGGSVLRYVELAQALGTDQPFYALQARGLEGAQEPLETVEALASAYIEEIKTVQAHGPYRLGGWSFGGVVAFEMAQQFKAQGEAVQLLLMIDSGKSERSPDGSVQEVEVAQEFLSNLLGLYDQETELGDEWQATLFSRERELTSDNVGSFLYNLIKHQPELADFTEEKWIRMYRVFRANYLAFHRYVPDVYDGEVQFFKAGHHDAGAFGWEQVMSGSLEILFHEGTHFNLLQAPRIEQVVSQMRARLDRLSINV